MARKKKRRLELLATHTGVGHATSRPHLDQETKSAELEAFESAISTVVFAINQFRCIIRPVLSQRFFALTKFEART